MSLCKASFSQKDTETVLNPQFSMKSVTCTASAFISETVLRQKYLENHLSTREIAEEFSCSKTRVRKLLLKYNIPLRQRSERYCSRWMPYGKRRVGGKIVDHQGELRTIATIKQMHAEGVSVAAIGRFLNTMKIPTRRQGKGWDYYTVTAILKRARGDMWRSVGERWLYRPNSGLDTFLTVRYTPQACAATSRWGGRLPVAR